jgi:hypothetical protein
MYASMQYIYASNKISYEEQRNLLLRFGEGRNVPSMLWIEVVFLLLGPTKKASRRSPTRD